MSNTLYRKYRPQKFDQVIAQNHVKVTLQNEIASGKLAHAFLFSGPRGIGKTTVARILAKALNCKERKGFEPCDQCSSCIEIREGRSLDLVEIDAASNRGINEIRELREQTKYTPIKEKYKVFIIDEAHMLTTEAFNALLKTLEEPPAHAIFILATTEVHKIPETIISRCQRFDYKKIPLNDITSHLEDMAKKEGVRVEKKVIENIARISEGYLRDAISLLGQILALGEKEITEKVASLIIPRSDWQKIMEFVNRLFVGQTKEALILINQLLDEGGDLEHFARTIIETLRKILLAKVSSDWQELSWEAGEEWLKKLVKNTETISDQDLVNIIKIFLESFMDLKQTTIVQLPLEIAVVKVSEVLKHNPVGIKKDDDIDGQSESINQAFDYVQAREINPSASLRTGKSRNQNAENKEGRKTSLVSIEIVKQKWPEVIEALRENNHSLASFLKVGLPVNIEDERIVVGFQYNFHYERIKEAKNLEIVEKTFAKIFGQKLTISGLIDEKYKQESLTNNNEAVVVALENQKIPSARLRTGKKLNNQKNISAEASAREGDMVEAVIDALGGEVVG